MRPEALGVDELPPIGPAVLTMGVFDGVHLGHRAMLEATRDAARARAAASVALVFDPHPEEVLRPGIAVPYLAPPSANLRRIRELGISHALPVRFDVALRSLSAEEFLAALGRALDLRGLVMSPESAFGRDRGGTVARMRELGGEQGFEVIAVPPTMLDGAVVSSSRVREAIMEGDLATARRLGAPAGLEGELEIPGDGSSAGRLALAYLPVLPPAGRYAARVLEPEGSARTAVVQVGIAAETITLRVMGSRTSGPVTVELVAPLDAAVPSGGAEEDAAALAALGSA